LSQNVSLNAGYSLEHARISSHNGDLCYSTYNITAKNNLLFWQLHLSPELQL